MEAKMEMALVVAPGDCSGGAGSCSTFPSRLQNRNGPWPAGGAGPFLHAEFKLPSAGEEGQLLAWANDKGQTCRHRWRGKTGPRPG